MFTTAILCFLVLSLASAIPINEPPGSCSIIRQQKTLNWDFLLFTGEDAKPFDFIDLEAPGSGFVWRGEAWPTPDVTRPILFQNGQGWRVVNCSTYFAKDDKVSGGCTSPDLALLSIPNTKTGDAPPDKGKIGTIHGLNHSGRSFWAVYDLIEFRLTPIAYAHSNDLITVEVFGWRENGTLTNTIRTKIKGNEIGYRVQLPKGGWDKIIQWQVRVWWSNGSRATREEMQFLIDDVVIDEYALGATDMGCRYPTQTPTQPVGGAHTLGFDDISVLPGTPTPVPTPYEDYIFDSSYGSWEVVNSLSYPEGSPGRLGSSSKNNALLSSPIISDPSLNSAGLITSKDFLFDIESFHISVDNSTTGSQNPSDITVVIYSFDGCYHAYHESVSRSYEAIQLTSYSQEIRLSKANFDKDHAVSIWAWDIANDYKQIGFWIDGIVLKSWRDALGGVLPGCERCGFELAYWCEYPKQSRIEFEREG